MFAIAFDLTVAQAEALHPKGRASAAYADINHLLLEHGFRWVQGSVYLTDNEDLAALYGTMDALRETAWFAESVRDVRAFKVEHWSDFTAFFKGRQAP